MKTLTAKICNIYDNSSRLKLCKMFYLKSLMIPKTFCSFSLKFFYSRKICVFYNLVKKNTIIPNGKFTYFKISLFPFLHGLLPDLYLNWHHQQYIHLRSFKILNN